MVVIWQLGHGESQKCWQASTQVQTWQVLLSAVAPPFQGGGGGGWGGGVGGGIAHTAQAGDGLTWSQPAAAPQSPGIRGWEDVRQKACSHVHTMKINPIFRKN